jgi:hypothetical protein
VRTFPKHASARMRRPGLRQGVPRVHLLDGEVNEALLTEIFSSDGFARWSTRTNTRFGASSEGRARSCP